MSTLKFNGNEYNILYIDATLGSSAGDGATPATALATIPSPLVDKTCYIIRRQEDNETKYVDMPQSWYEDLRYIMFLGMPHSNDPMYALMEDSARTAWGTDTGKYARIRCNMSSYSNESTISSTSNKIVFKTSTVRNFYAANCYFYRDNNSGSTGSDAGSLAYMFAFDYSSKFADVTFSKCKFGYTQYNLENDDYISNNSDVATDTSKYPQYKARTYLYSKNTNSITFDGCVINHVHTMAYVSGSSYSNPPYGRPYCIYIGDTNTFMFTNNQYNVLYRNSYARDEEYFKYATGIFMYPNYSAGYSDYTVNERSKVYIKNIEINKIFTPTNAVITQQCLRVSCYDLQADNINVNYKVMGNQKLSSYSKCYSDSYALLLQATNSYSVSNIHADFTNSNINNIPLLRVYGSASTVGNPKRICENIYVKTDENGELDFKNAYIVEFVNSPWTWNGSTDVTNITSNSNYAYNDSGSTYQRNTFAGSIYNNIVVDAKNSTSYALFLTRTGVKSPYIRGRVRLENSSLDVKKHYHNVSSLTGVDMYGSSYYKCDDFEANLDYPSYSGTSQINWQPQSRSSVYVNKSNCIIADEIGYTTSYLGSSNNSFVCPNYIKTGQFFQRNESCFCKSWNTVRTGSNSQGSLRFSNNYIDVHNNHPLIVGCEPYSGIQVVPNSIGKKVLTAYVATKNLDETEQGYTGRLCFRVITKEPYSDYYDSTKINYREHEFTSNSAGWQADTSTWSGDTNLKTMKCEIPIEVFTLDEPIDVKIYFNWYSVNGYLYVDPDFKLRDVA